MVILQEWLANKDNNLRKMEEKLGSVSFGTDRKTSCTALDSLESLVGHVKQTIDYALSTLKAHSYSDCHSHTLADHEETTIAQRVGFAAVGRIHVLFYHRHGPERQEGPRYRTYTTDRLPTPSSSSKQPRSAGQFSSVKLMIPTGDSTPKYKTYFY